MNPRFSEGSRFFGDSMRLQNTTSRRRARRNARRFFKVGIEHLQVMLRGDAFAVAKPRADDVGGEHFRQFGLPTRSQVVPQSRPREQAGFLDDLLKSSSQIDGSSVTESSGFALQAWQNEIGTFRGLVHIFQEWSQLREDWNAPHLSRFHHAGCVTSA